MRHYKRNSRKAYEFRRGLFTALLGFLSDDRLKKAAPVDHSTDLRLSLTIVILINQDIISIHSEAGYAGERHFAAVPNVPEPTQRHAWPCCQASPGLSLCEFQTRPSNHLFARQTVPLPSPPSAIDVLDACSSTPIRCSA